MNELEGIERQDVKIQKYSRSNMKNHKLANGKLCAAPGSSSALTLQQRLAGQEALLQELTENYKALEQRLIAQTELIQHCKKVVNEEWEARKAELLEQLTLEYLPKLPSIFQERVLLDVQTRKQEIDQYLLERIKAKFLLKP